MLVELAIWGTECDEFTVYQTTSDAKNEVGKMMLELRVSGDWASL